MELVCERKIKADGSKVVCGISVCGERSLRTRLGIARLQHSVTGGICIYYEMGDLLAQPAELPW